jgi:octaprenyl-diphosphate synthase
MSGLTALLADLYAPITDELRAAQRIFDEELRSDLPFVNTWCDRVRSYRGKMLRPALLLLAGRASGALSRSHHTLAAVVEMVHMATLVHDDVLDNADERRRLPTICASAGNVAAVLWGDYLISHAFHLCSSLDSQYASRRIGATTNEVCIGELLQNQRSGDDRITESEYFDIIRRKTGALTAVCCELGAACAGADEGTVRALHDYGMLTGSAFQITDDVLDVVGDRRQVGKTLRIDLALGKLTLPTIHCLAHAREPAASELRSVVRGEAPCDEIRLRNWIEETDSAHYALSVARDFVRKAVDLLDAVPPSDARSSLIALAEFIVHRRF